MSSPSPPEFQTVCRVADIPVGGGKICFLQGERLAVFRIGERWFATDDLCPHAGASLALGIVRGDTVACRIHHWQFSLDDGRRLDDPAARCGIRTYPVRRVGDEIQVCLDPLRDAAPR